jgi:hypothetical protein
MEPHREEGKKKVEQYNKFFSPKRRLGEGKMGASSFDECTLADA